MRALLLMVGLAWSVPALAHIHLISPEARYGENQQKVGPCGRAGGERTDRVTVFEPGATIEVVWEETIAHPGYYRIAFDEDGDDDLGDPLAPDGTNPPDVLVLAEVGDGDSRPYSVEVTLPDVECTRCTLQLVQVMTDKAPYGDGNDLYYACADLELRYDGGTGTDPDPVDTDNGLDPGDPDPAELPDGDAPAREKGCATAGGAVGGLPILPALLLLRRRRARA